MASLLEEDVCDDVFWMHILPLLNLKDYVALASTSKTMRRRCFWIPDSRPGLTIPQRDLYQLMAPVSRKEQDEIIATAHSNLKWMNLTVRMIRSRKQHARTQIVVCASLCLNFNGGCGQLL